MFSSSDYNSAVPQFTNGNYASNPINPLYIEEPGAVDYNRGTEPLETLPAQWWNWFGNQFTSRFNKLNIYVRNIFNELTQLLSLVNMSPDGTEATPTINQLKTAFETEYPKYLALIMYPVGSLYWTGKAPDDGGDPNTLFGGTWVQIKGKFIFAKGDSDTLNATGGSKTVTLTENQIPSHRHTGTTDNGGVQHTHGMNHIHYTSGTTGGAGGHSHTTNSQSTSTTGGMSGNATGNARFRHISYGTILDASGNMTRNNNGVTANYATVVNDNASTWNLNLDVSHTHDFSHTHGTNSVADHTHSWGNWSGGSKTTDGSADRTSTDNASAYSHTHGFTSGYTGGGQAHDNMPPYVVKYCWERTA